MGSDKVSKNIIDDMNSLINMSREELDETLLDEKYNRANLRELIRRIIPELRNYRDLFLAEYEGKIPGNLSQIIMNIEAIDGIKDYYLHREYNTGDLELNIEFDNDIADNNLEHMGIKEIDLCAFWE